MTSPVAVVTDSTSCIPAELAQKWGVSVVGMQLDIDGMLDEEHRVPIEYLVDAMNQDLPVSTSPPDPGAFFWTYADLAAHGARAIVSIHLSAKLSATVEAARAAATHLRVPVYVIDSHTVAMSLGFAALSAARVAAAGGDAKRVRAAAKRRSEQAAELVYVNTLEFLHRGGRIGAASHLIGTAFSVKPVLTVADGEVKPLGRAVGTSRALRKLVDTAVNRAGDQPVDVALEWFDTDEHIPMVRRHIERSVPALNDVIVTRVTAILGAHIGPGAVGVTVSPL
jgi:DegV family protein with EDD domain